MISLVQNELTKIYSKKSSWIYKAIIVMVAVLGGFIYGSVYKETENYWLFMNDFVVGGGVLITLFAVMVCSSAVSSEFAKGTIKQLLIRPHKRWSILLAKYIASIIYITILTITLVAALYIAGYLIFGSGDYSEVIILGFEGGKEVVVGEQFFLKLAYFLPGLLMLATISFMLSSLFRNQSLAVGISIFALLFTSVLGGVITLIADKFTWVKYLLFPHLDLTVYAVQDKMFDTISFSTSMIILGIHYVLFMAVVFWHFSKKDIFV
jgi:ABC-2 type transport system permease protein